MPFVFCRRQVSQSGREVLHVFLVSIAVPSPPQPRVSVKHLIKNKKCSLFTIGRFDEEEEAARAYNKAIRDAGLEVKRHINAVDATGALMPRKYGSVRSAVVERVLPKPIVLTSPRTSAARSTAASNFS